MDFLVTALYSQQSELFKDNLAGALLTKFDAGNKVMRPYVRFVSAEHLRNTDIKPQGWALDDNGVLLADTMCRNEFNTGLARYIERASDTGIDYPSSIAVGLIDFVLIACENEGVIIQNYDTLMTQQATDVKSMSLDGSMEKKEEPVFVSFRSMRVSMSSFNIYAPYKTNAEKYRTLSLIDITTDESIPFVVSIPEDKVGAYSSFKEYMSECPAPEGIEEYRCFKVDIPFLPAYTFMGEAFVNYLAYNVAYYTMGLKVIDSFLADNHYIPDSYKAEEEPERVRRKPAHNVRIEHGYKEPHLAQLLDSLGNQQKLRDLINQYPEAYITLNWVQVVFNSKPADCAWDSDIMCQTCIQLKYSCRAELLRFSLELLAQRYYVQTVGFLGDELPDILKGGGVSGNSIKRTTW